MKDEEYDGESYEPKELDPQELELQLSAPYELVPKVPVPYEPVPKDDPNVLPVKYELSELQNDESGRIVDDEDDEEDEEDDYYYIDDEDEDQSDEGKEEKIQLKSLPSFVIIGIGGFEVDPLFHLQSCHCDSQQASQCQNLSIELQLPPIFHHLQQQRLICRQASLEDRMKEAGIVDLILG
ncbi:MAG: hypothetical protein EZS28_007969 [Streblomastix strix]|uniref:Uncharacterized protein n=1 Tax=Streblomastix strix TaxID=222440 RepID=A0A5J4WNI9_9EUKA|nr:MAG: hypothetical protein EZS28_007969 [Streblomastix strix]